MYRLIGIGTTGVFWGIGSVKNACNYRSDTDSFKAALTMKMVVITDKHSKIIKKVVNFNYYTSTYKPNNTGIIGIAKLEVDFTSAISRQLLRPQKTF